MHDGTISRRGVFGWLFAGVAALSGATRNRAQASVDTAPPAIPEDTAQYTYDEFGRLLSVVDCEGGRTTTFDVCVREF